MIWKSNIESMKKILLVITALFTSQIFAQKAEEIDLSHWKLELPSGYSASEWKLSNFQKDRFAKPFFYLDSVDGSLVMEAYPVTGTSKAKYTKTSLREQLTAGESSNNWSMAEGGTLVADFEVTKMSKENPKKYHRTILFQIQGRTNEAQEEEYALEKAINLPLITVYWQDERIRVQRKVLKDVATMNKELVLKDSWESDAGRFFNKKIGFEKAHIEIKVQEGRVEIHLNDQKPIVYRDANIRKWPLENYFIAGNYLQTRVVESHAIVKYHKLQVIH